MRICVYLLAMLSLPALAATKAKAPKETLHQSRGFHQGECHEGIVELDCKAKCYLDFWPDSSGTISFNVNPAPKEKSGLFLAKVKVSSAEGNTLEILSLKPVEKEEAEEAAEATDYLSKPVACEKKKQ